jgi:hypothetical protein
LFCGIFPLFGRFNSAVRRRSGIHPQALDLLVILDEKSGFFSPDIGDFPANSAAAAEFGLKPRA